jgi:hypothetical protein
MHKEIRSRINSAKSCYHPVHNELSFCFQTQKIKIHRNTSWSVKLGLSYLGKTTSRHHSTTGHVGICLGRRGRKWQENGENGIMKNFINCIVCQLLLQ